MRPVRYFVSMLVPAVTFASTAFAESVQVTVRFTGKPPVMQEINRKSDPYCAKTRMKDEEVVVSEGKLENVFVRVSRGTPSVPGTGEVVVEQHECMYRPRMSGAVAGQTIVVKNGDNTLHNVHTYVGQRTLFNRAQPPGSPEVKDALKPSDKNEVVRFKCDVHPWMGAYVVVSDNPYFAVTDKHGTARIDGLKPGSYTIETWQERYGAKSAEVTVEPGKTAELTIEYSGNEPKPPLRGSI
jgi:plastocyanin